MKIRQKMEEEEEEKDEAPVPETTTMIVPMNGGRLGQKRVKFSLRVCNMTKALEVTIDGKIIGVYVPGSGRCFSAILGNIPRKYMRAQVLSSSDQDNWYWQLPDINEGQTISFRMIETSEKGVPPQRVVPMSEEAEE
jgi:hypothetical protein